MSYRAQQVILHFGLAKTGSTSIQRALFEQREHLLKTQGVLYPGLEENHFHLQSLFAENPESLIQIQRLGLPDTTAVTAFLRSYRERMLDEISRTRPRRIIISSEYFSGMSVAELEAMRSFLEIIAEDIISFAYVRDPWSFAISLTQEMIRNGCIDTPVKLNYMESNIEIIKKFEESFGARLTISPYVQGANRIDVVADFCSRIGIELDSDSEERKESRQKLNIKMTREAASVMLHLNRLYPTFDKQGHYLQDGSRDWMIEALLGISLQTTPISISKDTAKRIYDAAKNDIDFMEKTYFSGERAFTNLYSSMQRDDFDDEISVSTLPQERLVEFMLPAMRALSDRAVHYRKQMMHNIVERALWMGKYYVQAGNLDSARQCFEDALKIDPLHDEARRQIDALHNTTPTQ